MEKIEEFTEERIEELVQMIMRQTEYTAMEANEKLEECDYDHIKVIKKYLGIPEKKEAKIKSVNQEIYRQLRSKLNASTKEYTDEQYSKLQKDIDENNK
jgi:hypothetical protein